MMNDKNRASVASEKNRIVWSQNLVKFQDSLKRRGHIALEECKLHEKNRMPLKTQIIGRFQYLGNWARSKDERIKIISEEAVLLWSKLNFPHVSFENVKYKIKAVIKNYEDCRKKGNFKDFDGIFNITKEDGVWLCKEDKDLYILQKETQGATGYTTEKLDSMQKIHPSKRTRHQKDSVFDSGNVSEAVETYEDMEIDSDNDFDYISSFAENSSRTYNKAKAARNLVVQCKLSTNKASKVCKTQQVQGINLPTPTQSAVYKSMIKEALRIQKQMEITLKNDNYSLHFDGKRINDMEYVVILLKNEEKEIYLDILCLDNGRSDTIFKAMCSVLDKFHLWNSIKMIVCDTTAVNTGRENGIVIKLQNLFASKAIMKPQFIGCQHHILDRVLKIVMDSELGAETRSPNIGYSFVSELQNSYKELINQFANGEEHIPDSPEGLIWRDDMKFLFHLTRVFQFYGRFGTFPKVKFQKIPNLSNARWNSRAILALLAFILMTEKRDKLSKICSFIANDWARLWFTNQMFNENDYNDLMSCLQGHEKAQRTVQNFWSKEPSIIQIPRSNQCAERAIKVMQELHETCKSDEKLRVKCVLNNFNNF